MNYKNLYKLFSFKELIIINVRYKKSEMYMSELNDLFNTFNSSKNIFNAKSMFTFRG